MFYDQNRLWDFSCYYGKNVIHKLSIKIKINTLIQAVSELLVRFKFWIHYIESAYMIEEITERNRTAWSSVSPKKKSNWNDNVNSQMNIIFIHSIYNIYFVKCKINEEGKTRQRLSLFLENERWGLNGLKNDWTTSSGWTS